MLSGKELELSKDLALMAGKAIMGIYSGGFSVHKKDDQRQSPVTQADLAANRIIVDGIRKHFRDDAVLTEEDKDDGKRLGRRRVWIIDPLDGTKEFISGNGEFTVNIALVEDKKPVLGVICAPAIGEIYYAGKAMGAFMEKEGKAARISASKTDEVSQMTIVKSRSHASESLMPIIGRFKEAIPMGSSLKGCLIAAGKADAYFRLGPVNEWDICAMHAIVSESGGEMTLLSGRQITYNNMETLIKGFLVSNNAIHARLLGMVDQK